MGARSGYAQTKRLFHKRFLFVFFYWALAVYISRMRKDFFERLWKKSFQRFEKIHEISMYKIFFVQYWLDVKIRRKCPKIYDKITIKYYF